MGIDIGEKFSAFCFTNLSISSDIPETLELGSGICAARRLPVEFANHWRDWLGSLKIEAIESSNFVLLTKAISQTPQNLDQENYNLRCRLDYFMKGLLLQGCPQYEKGVTLNGSHFDGRTEIRQLGDLEDYRPSYGLPPLEVGTSELQRAIFFADRLKRIANGDDDWARLRRGLKALFQGSEEYEGGDRLHQFTRSLEALIKPDIGNTRSQFAHRCQTFSLAGTETQESLLQIFDIRSHVEHLHSPLDALKGSETDRIILANRRTRQADLLSRFALAQVLESEDLLQAFRTDGTIDSFWHMQDHERIRVWGNRLDLTNIS